VADIRMVRIYLTEADKLINAIMTYLHLEANVHGVTVVKATAGFDSQGILHSAASPNSTSGNMPMMLEFYDEAEKTERVITHLRSMIGSNHILTWPVTIV
jgi:PII-like signaling protein